MARREINDRTHLGLATEDRSSKILREEEPKGSPNVLPRCNRPRVR